MAYLDCGLIITVSYDKTLKVWALQNSLNCIATMQEQDEIRCLTIQHSDEDISILYALERTLKCLSLQKAKTTKIAEL